MQFETPKQAEIDRNLEAFFKLQPALVSTHAGKNALMRGGEIEGFYDTPLDAQEAGQNKFPDGIFSVQSIDVETNDLGFYSNAVHLWPA